MEPNGTPSNLTGALLHHAGQSVYNRLFELTTKAEFDRMNLFKC